jgi:hypothetical protein
MDPRLRRLLRAAGDSPELRRLALQLEAELGDRAVLEKSIDALTALLQRRKSAPSKGSAARPLESSTLAIFDLSPRLKVRSANDTARQLCGRDPKGARLLEVLEPLDAETVAAKWLKKLAQGEPVAKAVACSTEDGRPCARRWRRTSRGASRSWSTSTACATRTASTAGSKCAAPRGATPRAPRCAPLA